jgi:glycosyltransferase involved in cell wall biosynthesis
VRILQLASSYPLEQNDGTAPFVRSIARALAARGHEVRVLVPERAGAPRRTVEPGLTVDWVPYAPHPRLRIIGHAQSLHNDMRLRPLVFMVLPLYLRALLAAGGSLCRTWRPDVIHAHWVVPNGPVAALLARLYRLPLAISLHGSDIFMALRSPLYSLAAAWSFGRSTAVIACSPALRDGALRLHARPCCVHLLPHGADPQRFRPPAELPADGTPPIVLSLGRLVPKKGLDILMAAAPSILSAAPEAEIWIAGEGTQRGELEARRDSLAPDLARRVRFLGLVPWDDVPAVLRRATVFVVPSVRDDAGNEDGLPTIILEAMACACPIVASNIAGVPLVVRHGQNGLLTPPGDSAALASQVIALLADPPRRARIGEAGRALVERELTWSAIAARMEPLLRPDPPAADISGGRRPASFFDVSEPH